MTRPSAAANRNPRSGAPPDCARKVVPRRYRQPVKATQHQDPVTVTICGTFNLGLPAVAEAVEFFSSSGVTVLSPADPTPVEVLDGFLYVKSDQHRNPALVESRHLQAIAASRFIWLVAPDGYVGLAGAMEIGFATAIGVPVFSIDRVIDPNVAPYVKRVPSARAAFERSASVDPPQADAGFLIDPQSAADNAHAAVEQLRYALTTRAADTDMRVTASVAALHRTLAGLSS